MKKIYFLASAIALVGSVSAQKVTSTLNHVPNATTSNHSNANQLIKKAPTDVLWHEDFRNGEAGYEVVSGASAGIWTKASLGAADYTTVWKFDQTGPTGQYTTNIGALESESAANGWMLFDINKQTDTENNGGFIGADAYIESPAIDVSAMTNYLGLQFDHYYRTCCAGGGIYPVDLFVGYNDGSAWVWKELNSGNSSHNTTPGDGSANVETRLLGITDVTDLAKANTGEVKFRFHWNSDLNASVSYYFWMLDDVKIVEVEEYDARHDKMYAGDIYNAFDPYMIPQNQAHQMIVGSDISNIGGRDLTNLQLDVTITEDATTTQVYNGQSDATTLAVATDVMFTDDAANTATNVYHNTATSVFNNGIHTISIEAIADNDDETTNNTLTAKFEYSDYEYGHYNPSSNDVGVYQVNDDTEEGSILSATLIYNDAFVRGISIQFEDGTTLTNTDNQDFYLSIWNGDLTEELIGKEFTLTSDMVGAGTQVFFFDDPIEVYQDDVIYTKITGYGAGDELLIAADYDGDDDNSTALILDQQYGASQDPYLNLFITPTDSEISCEDAQEQNLPWYEAQCLVSIDENAGFGFTLGQNTPNPATNNTTIDYTIGSTENVTLEVVDITGKVVMTLNEGNKAVGAHRVELNTNNLTNGVYFYSLTAGQNKMTNKMIVNK